MKINKLKAYIAIFPESREFIKKPRRPQKSNANIEKNDTI